MLGCMRSDGNVLYLDSERRCEAGRRGNALDGCGGGSGHHIQPASSVSGAGVYSDRLAIPSDNDCPHTALGQATLRDLEILCRSILMESVIAGDRRTSEVCKAIVEFLCEIGPRHGEVV